MTSVEGLRRIDVVGNSSVSKECRDVGRQVVAKAKKIRNGRVERMRIDTCAPQRFERRVARLFAWRQASLGRLRRGCLATRASQARTPSQPCGPWLRGGRHARAEFAMDAIAERQQRMIEVERHARIEVELGAHPRFIECRPEMRG
ncbi:hypothetical protein [Trinickia dinghuensis]|uniref:hypothetical protein n=1 Tax=Trinickia dinghuensis TaxID=2291023 RepID=UPI0011C02395|nr:hypothetical protein [Trinickia dinghuensis]